MYNVATKPRLKGECSNMAWNQRVAAGWPKCAAVMFGLNAVAAPASADNPWPERATEDLRFIHDMVAESHPGPALDPGFAALLDDTLPAAERMAANIDDLSGYIYLLSAYVNALPDHHLSVWGARDHPEWNSAPRAQTAYPGFITAWRNGRFEVRGAPFFGPVKNGWLLVSCDGMTPEELAAANIFATVGDPAQPADWGRHGPYLFVDQGQPGFVRPEACVFDGAPSDAPVPLPWYEVSMRDLWEDANAAAFGTPPQAGARTLPDGGLWVSLPSFDPGVLTQDMATPIGAALEAGRSAPYVVFDLRGNSGGSSFMADGFAAALLGLDWVNAQRAAGARGEAPDLVRASAGNRDWFVNFRTRLVGNGGNAGTIAYLDGLIAAIDAALANGEDLAMLGGGQPATGRTELPDPAYDGRVFALTDGNAFSSALLFIDLVLLYPRAEQIGWPTRAHGLYGELRQVPLPSGWAVLGFSTKAFMARGENAEQPFLPPEPWQGEISDTAALEAWVMDEMATQAQGR